jgi:signal transduction histidine kinase/CheY-like chemotaxis protein
MRPIGLDLSVVSRWLLQPRLAKAGGACVAIALALFGAERIREYRMADQEMREPARAMARLVAHASYGGLAFEDAAATRESYNGALRNPSTVYVRVLDEAGVVRASDGAVASPWARPMLSEAREVLVAGTLHLAEPVRDAEGRAVGEVQLGYSVASRLRQRDVDLGLFLLFLLLVAMGGAIVAAGVRERRLMQETLAKTDRLASIGRLSASVAHEINNPLSYIITNTHFATEQLSDFVDGKLSVEELRADASDIVAALTDSCEGAERVRKIVADLKSQARGDDASPKPTDVGAAVTAAVKLVSKDARERATLVVDMPDLPLVTANEGRLVQVLVNLLTNALQALPERPHDENRIEVSGRLEGARVVVDVRDNGMGIGPKTLRHLFEPFFTTKPQGEGTGLGLFLCHSIVKSFGGDIGVQTKVGEGSTFSIRLRQAEADASLATPAAASDAPDSARHRGRLLVVDDEVPLGRALGRQLGRRHDVVVVSEGSQALALLRRDSAFDVVLCDVMMPGVSGIDVFQNAKAECPGLERRFLFMTGGTFTEGARRFIAQSGVPRLDKPLDLRVVEREIERRIANPQ